MHCHQCGAVLNRCASHVNRSVKQGRPMFCNKSCFGLSRRRANPPTEAERKAAKQAYDAIRRLAKHEEIIAKKRAHYIANRERILAEQTVYRKAHMHRHVAYCQRPEYREWKSAYDARYKAAKHFGEFAEAAMLLRDIEQEIEKRATRYEVYMTNGTINKAQTRRRAL